MDSSDSHDNNIDLDTSVMIERGNNADDPENGSCTEKHNSNRYLMLVIGAANFEKWQKLKSLTGLSDNVEFAAWVISLVENSLISEPVDSLGFQDSAEGGNKTDLERPATSDCKETIDLSSTEYDTGGNNYVRLISSPETQFSDTFSFTTEPKIQRSGEYGRNNNNDMPATKDHSEVYDEESHDEQISTEVKDTHIDKIQCETTVCITKCTTNHFSQSPVSTAENDDFSRRTCPACGKLFSTAGNCLAHFKAFHADGKLIQCTYDGCNRTFARKHNMQLHLRSHTGEKPYRCNICNRGFSMRHSLNSHLATHTGERRYQCTYCGKCFTQNSNLQVHLHIHTDTKPHACEICGKRFIQKSSLVSHMPVHQKETSRNFLCPICGRAFLRDTNLKFHMKNHEEKKVDCKQCGKLFHHSSSLMKHMRLHTGDKPYLCAICLRNFADSSNLKKHMLTHTDKPRPGKFQCDQCSKSFSHSSSLKNHRCAAKKLVTAQADSNTESFMADASLTTVPQFPSQMISFVYM